METIFLGILLLIETTFLVWNLKTKNYHRKERCIARGVQLIILIFLCVTNMLQWGFQYYLITFLFILQCIIGLLRLRKKEIKPFKTWKVVVRFIGNCLLYAFALIAAFIFPKYETLEATGSYPVATALYTYTDSSRTETYTQTGENRKVNVEFWSPEDDSQKYPLLVFSHGMNGIKATNESLFRELASQGYVVCSIDHPYHSMFTTDTDGKTTIVSSDYLNQYKIASTTDDAQLVLDYITEWMDIRTQDINFVIDTILTEAKADTSGVYQLVDDYTIFTGGHSLGGAAALGVARQRKDIKAVISLEAPYFNDIESVSGNAFHWNEEEFPVPVLQIYSDSLWKEYAGGSSITYEQNRKMVTDPSKGIYNVHIQNAGHLGLTDLALVSPLITNIVDGGLNKRNAHETLAVINDVSLQFLDHYGKDGTLPSIAEEY